MKIHGFSSNMFGWYTRNELDGKDRSLEQMIYDCAQAGLDAVEIDATPETVSILKANQLQLSSSYAGGHFHKPWAALEVDQNIMPMAHRLKSSGGKDFIVNADPKGGWSSPLPKTEDELKMQGENLARLGDLIQPLGLRLCFHNHADTQDMAEGDMRSVVEYSSPLVGLCIDTGWAHAAGCDPIAWAKQYSNRVFAVHLRNQLGSVPTENVFDGEIDMAEFMETLNEIHYEGWLTFELWHRKDTNPQLTMIEAVKESITYLKNSISSIQSNTLKSTL
ncbi:sugar phosphate isomerase/epimerase family protein [Fictibacillus terranigra]|uniref:Sugar phosphate isomerase/epimerase family protein n=1 Tax=Fictibacillus terranigra TaxID=3058424 RepID=A0ABT8EDJ3_9BACL|nr:sugar phosphate isomerase/epimerase family protein [Fictibacillus sp. CENA-BCM004]MDN4076007.1 sugar phosphate isomerase/epimerase family protein [Fictibacillus sp. CENA-BCM004]